MPKYVTRVCILIVSFAHMLRVSSATDNVTTQRWRVVYRTDRTGWYGVRRRPANCARDCLCSEAAPLIGGGQLGSAAMNATGGVDEQLKADFSQTDAAALELMVTLRRRREMQAREQKHPLRLQTSGIDEPEAEALYVNALAGDSEAITKLLQKWQASDEPAAEVPAAAEAVVAPPAKGKGKKSEPAPTDVPPPEEAAAAPAPASAPDPWQVRDVYGFDPLSVASGAGHLDALTALLESGGDMNVSNPLCGRTALHRAAERGHADVVDSLLTRGAMPARVPEAVGRGWAGGPVCQAMGWRVWSKGQVAMWKSMPWRVTAAFAESTLVPFALAPTTLAAAAALATAVAGGNGGGGE
eukprot:6186020-Pleurochrysis_carterae.AAC.1